MQCLLFHSPPHAATFSSHRIVGKKIGRLPTTSLHHPSFVCRSVTTDGDNVPRRGIEIKINSHEKKEEENIQEKKEEEFLPPSKGVDRFLTQVLLGLSALTLIRSHTAKFPSKTNPRIMMACVTGLLIYASSAKDIISIWRLPSPVPWYVWSARLSMGMGLVIFLGALAYFWVF